MKIKIDLKVGRVVRYFILADLALFAGWGLVSPIFSVFIIEEVAGATLITVGIAAGLYWLVKSVLQLPVANYLDKRKGEVDDFYTLIAGLFIATFSAFLLVLVAEPWELFLVQIVHAIGFALYVPSWSGIFSRHLDGDRVSFDWALNSTALGISSGIGGFLGGLIASWLGFKAVFILAAFLSMFSALILLAAPGLIIPNKKGIRLRRPLFMKDHNPTSVPR